jgi:hypothetical protein
MKRSILAGIAGLLVWLVVASVLDRLLRVFLPGYLAAEPTFTFTLGMMAARLIMGAVSSLLAGAAAAWIAPTGSRVPWVIGVILLAVFIPSHVALWQHFPIWYHLTFLVTLVPLVVLGWRLQRAAAAPRPVVRGA